MRARATQSCGTLCASTLGTATETAMSTDRLLASRLSSLSDTVARFAVSRG